MNRVIYDNNCSFCCKIKSIISYLDIFNYFEWISIERSNNLELQIDKNLALTTIVLITSKNIRLTEFSACRYIISRNILINFK